MYNKRISKLGGCLPSPAGIHPGLVLGRLPLHHGDFGLALDGQVLLPAAPTQQVVRVPAAALPPEPAVHVGAVAAVTLPVGAAAAARVALLHVLVEVGHVGLAQLAHHHLVPVVRLAHVLRGGTAAERVTHMKTKVHTRDRVGEDSGDASQHESQRAARRLKRQATHRSVFSRSFQREPSREEESTP